MGSAESFVVMVKRMFVISFQQFKSTMEHCWLNIKYATISRWQTIDNLGETQYRSVFRTHHSIMSNLKNS